MPHLPLRFGVATPVVTLLPRRRPTWEADAGPAELREIAVAADALGYHHLTCSEHVGIPTEIAKVRGGRYYDPLATFGFMAGMTHSIKFLTHVIVLPYHHPLAIAKRYGTLDRLSGGRLILGIGVGTLKEEFELLNAEFETRGERYYDALAALRAAWGKRLPEYKGTHYRFRDFIIDPWAQQAHVPFWLGGRTPRSLRRALVAAEGWDPFGLSLEELGALLRRAQDWPEWERRSENFEVVLGFEEALDIALDDELERMVELVGRTRDAGATLINVSFRSHSLEHHLEQLGRFKHEVAPQFA